ncbi:MAG: hypothetical protein RMN51_13585, partial [Verrucomicrobiota bacterium]|nr:hypothetical protein [Verrucomicrobiota bacterium]
MEQLTALVLPLDTEPTLSTVRDALRRAFSVEAVTERFFRDYKKVFADLQTRLSECSRDNKWAHDYALQL